jgi:hypothetical protein
MVATLILGPILCLTAVTSILVLGWQTTVMHNRIVHFAGVDRVSSGWVMGPRAQGAVVRLLGGLSRNIRLGLGAAVCLGIATFPFAVFWMVSWWAGWENSFNKGYEQAFVGPLLGFSGIAVFALVMVYLPMGLAHQAAENRAFALFEFGRVRSAVACAGWRYTLWTIAALILALPLFAARGLPVFAEEIIPGFADMTGPEIKELSMQISLGVAIYVFFSTTFLRSWSASIYARAALRACRGRDATLWADSVIDASPVRPTGRRPWALARVLYLMVMLLAWAGIAVLIFVGQFLNHDWHMWLTHPFVLLPWGG